MPEASENTAKRGISRVGGMSRIYGENSCSTNIGVFMRPFRLLAPAAAVIVIALAGCSAATPDGGPDDGMLTAEDSPLSEYLDASYSAGLSPEDQERADAAA